MSDASTSGREGRPSPDALLKAAQRDGRGRLKIFLGAAPGVGKTYAMLAAAHERLKEGVDLVAGVIETHGRLETEALLAGLAVIPGRRVEYKSHVLREMDLDAILARRPRLVLVDELAHTNAPGSRHHKRYLDVQELLAAGIDVYSTVNIQHVESLNDVVAQITRIRVRETLPDSVIDQADEIELVDLTPDDLIQRLRDGKVYVHTTATRALGHYFSPGNLTALRELALRRTAQRVDAQLLDHMQAHAIQGPWAAGDRILVCVDHRGGTALVRYAKRMAERLRAAWTVLHVDLPSGATLSDGDHAKIADALRMAEALGAETVTIPGADVAKDIVDYARANNFSHIVIGNMVRRPWWRRSIATGVINATHDIPVHVIGTTAEASPRTPVARRGGPGRPMIAYLGAAGVVGAAIVVGLALRQVLNVSSIALVFLTAVLATAVRFGLWPSLFACLASVLAYNFFFLPPLYTFTIDDPENVVTLIFFALTALVGSKLAARARDQAVAANARARTTEELYKFSRKLAGIASLEDLLWATAYQIATMLNVRVVILLPDAPGGRTLVLRGAYPPEDEMDEADMAAARWSWEANRPAGRGSDTLPGAPRLFLPFGTAKGLVAIVGIDRAPDELGSQRALLTPDERRLLDALGDQAVVSIERIHLVDDVERSRLRSETERLREAMLTSISHDLRTPLSAIVGSVSTLQSFEETLDAGSKAELLTTIADEAERMGRFVANLLDMTRLESGAVTRRQEQVDLRELIGSTLTRAAKVLARHTVALDLPADLPLIPLDAVLLEQVLFNLLDNAAKYAPVGTSVMLRAWFDRSGRSVELQVIDEGPGIPADLVERIFDKFFRVHAADRTGAGTGLGLAVCRGFVEAMGGRISAGNRTDRSGAAFSLRFPVSTERTP